MKHVIRLSIWQRQKETPGVEKAPGVSSPQRKESGRSGRDDGELRFGYDPAIHARRLRVYHRPRRLRMASPGVSSPQRKESGRSGRDDGELRFGYDPAIHARRLRVYHRPRRLRMASRISIFFAARRFEPLNSMG